MIQIHVSVLIALMGISAIAGFFCTAIYIERQAKRRPMPRPINPVSQEEIDRIRQRSQEMAETLERQAEPEPPKATIAEKLRQEEEKANQAMNHLLEVLRGTTRPVVVKTDRPVFVVHREGRC